MRVYKFLAAEFALKDIAERKIKLSKFEDMNDPFELAGSRWSDPAVDSDLTSYCAESYGALCFSKNWNNTLLWSHYADKHKGICLGFDIPDDGPLTPIYVSRSEVRETKELYGAVRSGYSEAPPESLMRKLLLKYRGWDYEDEVRMFGRLDGKNGDLSYFDFGEHLVLRQVIAGARCTNSRSEIIAPLQGYSEPIEIIKAQLSFESFEVVRDPAGFAS